MKAKRKPRSNRVASDDGLGVKAKANCGVWPKCNCILRGNWKRDCEPNFPVAVDCSGEARPHGE